MFCHKCGAQIAEGAAFCHKCGAKVIRTDSDWSEEDTCASQPFQATSAASIDPATDSTPEQRPDASVQADAPVDNCIQPIMQDHTNSIEFLGNRFEITEELEAYIAVRKPQEQAAFEIETHYLTIKDEMLSELAEIVCPEEKKFVEAVENDIKSLQQLLDSNAITPLTEFEVTTLPQIGQRIIFKYTKNDSITARQIHSILFTKPRALYLKVYNEFFDDVYSSVEQANSLHEGLKERRVLESQRSTPTYRGYGFGIRGTVNAVMGAATANMGMAVLQGFSNGLTASSDASLVKQRTTQGLMRAKQNLLIMAQEQVKKLTEICLDYLFRDMQAEIDALNIKPYRTFSQKDQTTIELRNENYDEALKEGDISPERYVAYAFSALCDDPCSQGHYCNLVQAACTLGDRGAADKILAFTAKLGIEQSVKRTIESESEGKIASLNNLDENDLEQTKQKIDIISKLYGTIAATETKRLRARLKCLEEMAQAHEKSKKYQKLIATGSTTVFIMPDHTVTALDSTEKVAHLKNVVSVAKGRYILALGSNGTVSFGGRDSKLVWPDAKSWRDIVAIAAGGQHYVGLKQDGSVVSTGQNVRGACDVSGWRDIVAITCGSGYTIGVKSDGSVVACGQFWDSPGSMVSNRLSSWRDIVSVSAGPNHILGLKKNGTVVAQGLKSCDRGECKVSDWWGIVAIAAGRSFSVGLRADGTAVAVGDNRYGQCNVGSWKNIVAIVCGSICTVGLKSDGTLIAVGDIKDESHKLSTYRLQLD